MKKIILNLIDGYKKLSYCFRALRVPTFIYTDCKFYPSCSDYATKAVIKHGAFRGLLMSLLRILKCSPFSKGGVDLP